MILGDSDLGYCAKFEGISRGGPFEVLLGALPQGRGAQAHEEGQEPQRGRAPKAPAPFVGAAEGRPSWPSSWA